MESPAEDQYKKLKQKSPEDTLVLVVDDNEVDRKVVSSTLARTGYKVETAENGQAGYEKAIDIKPDLVILDCEMPVMTGLDMCTKLKEHDEFKETPVIFLTSIDTPQNIIECFEADAENFLTKPVNAHVLLGHIETVLESSEDILREE